MVCAMTCLVCVCVSLSLREGESCGGSHKERTGRSIPALPSATYLSLAPIPFLRSGPGSTMLPVPEAQPAITLTTRPASLST